MIRRTVASLAMLACASSVSAQSTTPAPATVTFLSRAVFHMGGEHLSSADARLVWDADIGGELDLVDFTRGRLTFFANYEVVLGEELRAFDPNQGNYILEGSLSARLPHVEVAGVFYHQSRHLSDRDKDDPVDWNMIGARARRSWIVGAMHVESRADIRGSIQRTFVDYRWEFDGRLRADRVVRPGAGWLAAASVRHLGVDDSAGRGRQTGFRIEGGARFDGVAGAIELFVAGERRIDPFPREHSAATWVTVGFRLLSR